MPGSPILQNNTIVGAVTHVPAHDPTMGAVFPRNYAGYVMVKFGRGICPSPFLCYTIDCLQKTSKEHLHALAVLNSTGCIPTAVSGLIKRASKFLMVSALAVIWCMGLM